MNLTNALKMVLPSYIKSPEDAVEALRIFQEHCRDKGWPEMERAVGKALESAVGETPKP